MGVDVVFSAPQSVCAAIYPNAHAPRTASKYVLHAHRKTYKQEFKLSVFDMFDDVLVVVVRREFCRIIAS